MKSLKQNPRNNSINLETQQQNTLYYHKNVTPVECNICGCTVVHRALYNHKTTAICKLVQHFKDLAKLEYDDLKLLHHKIVLEDYKL
jgi:hypothetical protein